MSKFELGDKVQLKTKCHTWHVKHLVDCFTTDSQPEFEKENYEEVACLLGSKARRTKLKGIVDGYGDDCVHVTFQWKDLCCAFYVEPKDLKKL
jgi:hypothetical protein